MLTILERVRRCRHCNRDMTKAVTVSSYSANPFCDDCFDDRVKSANERQGPVIRTAVDGYVAIVPAPQKSA